MNWKRLSYIKKGIVFGLCVAFLGFIVSLAITFKVFIYDSWDTTFGAPGSTFFAFLFYSTIAFLTSFGVFIQIAIPACAIGAFIGWCYSKLHKKAIE